MDGDDFRLALGLRSTLIIDISLQSEGNKQAGDKVVITGRGFGHGLGLSQWGAYTAAKQGIDYRRILGNYYHNVELRNLPK
jgi:stage II sporulation protein D